MADPLAPLLRAYFKLEDKYYKFLDSLVERTKLPIYETLINPIEGLGIPSLPVYSLLLLLILGVLGFLLLMPAPTGGFLVQTSSSTGEPLDGVRLSVYAGGQLVGTALSESGIAVFSGIPLTTVSIKASKDGYNSATATLDLSKENSITLSLESLTPSGPRAPTTFPPSLPMNGPALGLSSATFLPPGTSPIVPSKNATIYVTVRNTTGAPVEALVRLFNAQTRQVLAEQISKNGQAVFKDVPSGLKAYLTAFSSFYLPLDNSRKAFWVNQSEIKLALTLRRFKLPDYMPDELNMTLLDEDGKPLCTEIKLFGQSGVELDSEEACGNVLLPTPGEGTLAFVSDGNLPLLVPAEVLFTLYNPDYNYTLLQQELADAPASAAILEDGSLVYQAAPGVIYKITEDGARIVVTQGDPEYSQLAAEISNQGLKAVMLEDGSIAVQLADDTIAVYDYAKITFDKVTPTNQEFAEIVAEADFTSSAIVRSDGSVAVLREDGTIAVHNEDGTVSVLTSTDSGYSALKQQIDQTGKPADELSDGSVVIQNADGSVTIYTFGLTSETYRPGTSEYTEVTAGASFTGEALVTGDSVIVLRSNGDIAIHYENGTVTVVTSTDAGYSALKTQVETGGSTAAELSDGSVVVQNTDGSVTVYETGLQSETISSGNERFDSMYANLDFSLTGLLREDANGVLESLVVRDENGVIQILYANGTVVVLNPGDAGYNELNSTLEQDGFPTALWEEEGAYVLDTPAGYVVVKFQYVDITVNEENERTWTDPATGGTVAVDGDTGEVTVTVTESTSENSSTLKVNAKLENNSPAAGAAISAALPNLFGVYVNLYDATTPDTGIVQFDDLTRGEWCQVLGSLNTLYGRLETLLDQPANEVTLVLSLPPVEVTYGEGAGEDAEAIDETAVGSDGTLSLSIAGPVFRDELGAPLETRTGMSSGFYYVDYTLTLSGTAALSKTPSGISLASESNPLEVGFYFNPVLLGQPGTEYAAVQYLDKDLLRTSGAEIADIQAGASYFDDVFADYMSDLWTAGSSSAEMKDSTSRLSFASISDALGGACFSEKVKFLNELIGSGCTTGACLSTFSKDREWVELNIRLKENKPITLRWGIRVNVPADAGTREVNINDRGWALSKGGTFLRVPADGTLSKDYRAGGTRSGPTDNWCKALTRSYSRKWNCGSVGKECCTPDSSCPDSGVCALTLPRVTIDRVLAAPSTGGNKLSYAPLIWDGQPLLATTLYTVFTGGPLLVDSQFTGVTSDLPPRCVQPSICTGGSRCTALCSPECQSSQFCDARALTEQSAFDMQADVIPFDVGFTYFDFDRIVADYMADFDPVGADALCWDYTTLNDPSVVWIQRSPTKKASLAIVGDADTPRFIRAWSPTSVATSGTCNECDPHEERAGFCKNCGNLNEPCCGTSCNAGMLCGGYSLQKPCGTDPNNPILLGWKWTDEAAGIGETYAACGKVIIGLKQMGPTWYLGSSLAPVMADASCTSITATSFDYLGGTLPPCFSRDAQGYITFDSTQCASVLPLPTGTNTVEVTMRASCQGTPSSKYSVTITLATQAYAQQLQEGTEVFEEATTSAGGICVDATKHWSQKKIVSIHNPSDAPLYNYPVLIEFDTAGPISAGNMQATGADLRLVSEAGQQEIIPFHLTAGTLNTAKTKLWFKVDSLQPGQVRDFSLYYGNPHASAPEYLTSPGLNPSTSNNIFWRFPGPANPLLAALLPDWSMFTFGLNYWTLQAPTGIDQIFFAIKSSSDQYNPYCLWAVGQPPVGVQQESGTPTQLTIFGAIIGSQLKTYAATTSLDGKKAAMYAMLDENYVPAGCPFQLSESRVCLKNPVQVSVNGVRLADEPCLPLPSPTPLPTAPPAVEIPPVLTPTPAPWPMFGQNPGHMSYTTSQVPAGPVYERWKIDFATGPPAIGADRVYAPIGNKVKSFNMNGNLQWSSPDLSGIVRLTPALDNDRVYALTETGHVYALRTDTGAQVWQYQLFPVASAAGSRSLQYVASTDTYTGEPTLFSGYLYLTSSSSTYALEASTGTLKWSAPVGSPFSPAVHPYRVFVAYVHQDWDSALYSFDASTGAQKWSTLTGTKPAFSPVVSGDYVYLVDAEYRRPQRFDRVTGSITVLGAVGNEFSSAPAVAFNNLYLARGVQASVLSADGSTIVTNKEMPGFLSSMITAGPDSTSGRALVAAPYDGRLYSLKLVNLVTDWQYNFMDTYFDRLEPVGVAANLVFVYSLKNSAGTIHALGPLAVSPSVSVSPAPPVTSAVSLTCSDGTAVGACSVTKPKYCVYNVVSDSLLLVDKATICGCPPNLVVSGDTCAAAVVWDVAVLDTATSFVGGLGSAVGGTVAWVSDAVGDMGTAVGGTFDSFLG